GYCLLTISCFIMLCIAGMNVFDAMNHTFATVSTGGFSTKSTSAASFSPMVQWILIFFMFASGVNFALLFFSTTKAGIQRLWNDPEYKWYLGSIILVTMLSCILLLIHGVMQDSSLEFIIRTCLFQVVSLITTTGFVTIDYSLWPSLILILFLFITFMGGSGGSTSGGFKVIRMIILTKLSTIGFIKRLHPNSIQAVKINDFVISENIFLSVALFFILYIAVLFLGTCCVSLFGLDLTTSFTAVLTSLTNVGPGLGDVGPVETFAPLPTSVKYILSFLMIVGRLELYTVLILFLPLFWRI
ncbi:MAG: TrkH family potassium uptake protein, partial [Desulfovibrionaceae bacterium]|nr:TrkH family potassium uptake protein [Desulfovibrionaceae bacterium]